jgi:hypothetical protein
MFLQWGRKGSESEDRKQITQYFSLSSEVYSKGGEKYDDI